VPDGISHVPPETPWTPTPTLPPTFAEWQLERNRELFAPSAKYPLRPDKALTPEQLAAARAQLGPAGFVVRNGPGRREQDRHPLTAEQLRDARAAATYGRS
jgi:hypothetical protein